MGKARLIAITAAAAAAAALPTAAPASAVAEKKVYDAGRCIVRADRSAAAQLLRTLPSSGEVSVDSGQLGDAAKCLGGSATVSAMALRGSVAQALFLKDFDRFAVQPQVASHLFADFDVPTDKTPGADPRTVAMYRLGDCVVRNEAMKMESFLRAGVGSAQEDQLFEYFGPIMSACQAGQEPLRISRAALRSVFAQAAYKVSVRYWTDDMYTASR